MKELELAETVRALRAEIVRAAPAAEGADFYFPVKEIQIEFHVGVTKSSEGEAGVKFWVVELGTSGALAKEEIQTVTVTLGAPVDKDGNPVPVKVAGGSAKKI
ncbi:MULTISPECIES: trypco2 family protein [unclassified Frankia]|uniref:trypco2 family protein n=1 Tax=unclassified Frankia TaxID=2632575 RepID=UPI002AD52EBA|nr:MULTISPECIES: trypco2 family protein [unclassified Frankia]